MMEDTTAYRNLGRRSAPQLADAPSELCSRPARPVAAGPEPPVHGERSWCLVNFMHPPGRQVEQVARPHVGHGRRRLRRRERRHVEPIDELLGFVVDESPRPVGLGPPRRHARRHGQPSRRSGRQQEESFGTLEDQVQVLERAVAVFTHADVLIADGDANDENDENEIAASYLRDAPPALASLLRAAGGGEPVFADVRARGVEREGEREDKQQQNENRVRFLDALAAAVRRVDAVAARSPLRSASGDPKETRVVAADVAAAAAARLPRLGMKAARRQRQEAKRKERNETGVSSMSSVSSVSSVSSDWLGDALAWVSSVVAPPPSKPPNASATETRYDADVLRDG